jgi:hypothetical protein
MRLCCLDVRKVYAAFMRLAGRVTWPALLGLVTQSARSFRGRLASLLIARFSDQLAQAV